MYKTGQLAANSGHDCNWMCSLGDFRGLGQLERALTFPAGRSDASFGVDDEGEYRVWRCMDPSLYGLFYDRNPDAEFMRDSFEPVRVVCIIFVISQEEKQENTNSFCSLSTSRVWNYFVDLKEKDLKKWKASYTVEASFIVPLVIGTMALAMKLGILCYEEVREGKEQQQSARLWEVEDFYHFQALKEVTHD